MSQTGQSGIMRDFIMLTQNGMQVKTYELFIFGIFPLIFLDSSCLRITETMDSETTDKGQYVICKLLSITHKASVSSVNGIMVSHSKDCSEN